MCYFSSKMQFSQHAVIGVCVLVLLLVAGCGSDDSASGADAGHPDDVETDSETPEENACGGIEELDVDPGESCDDGDGQWVCDGENDVICEVEEENACGGTAELDGEPGELCADGAGEWVCVMENQVSCQIDENVCGGTAELDGEPGESCEGGFGEWECNGEDEVVCVVDNNACGGTMELDGDPGESCDDGDGQWVCDGADVVVCSIEETNSCGGTSELDGEPGAECDDCGVWECDGSEAVTCGGTVDIQTDDDNCGQCGNICTSEQMCSEGQCGAIPLACEINEDFYGQLDSDDDEVEHSGGTPTTDPFTHQAGLGDIIDEVEAVLENYTSDEISNQIIAIEFDDIIEINGATVTAVEYRSDTNFWLGDADAGIYFRVFPDLAVDDEPNVGDRVSFGLESVQIFHGTLEVNEYSDWEIVEQDTEVSYIELADQELDVDAHYGRIVRMVGELSDTSWICAGDTCFEMSYGPYGEYTATFKTSSNFTYPGDCITYVGPLNSFPRFFVDDAAPQIDAGNGPNFGWNWYRTE